MAACAVIVINAKAGVEVGYPKAWDLCNKFNLPRVFFVTNMDDDNASYQILSVSSYPGALRHCRSHRSTCPIRENEKFVGFVNVVKMKKGRRFLEKQSVRRVPDSGLLHGEPGEDP